jgi:pimeloyl-ACP methyl ester carboxylesterase
LKNERRVIRFDLRGFGLTGPSPDRRYGFDEDVRLVIAVLDHLGIERCVLGGNSLGGGVSWRTAVEHPSRVEKLILVDAEGYATTPISQPLAFYFSGLPLHNWMVRNTFPRGLIEQGLRNVFGDPRKVTKETVVRTQELTECKGNRHALIQRGRQWKEQAKHAPQAHRIAEVKQPTLIIWSGRDRLIPPSAAHRFHRDIADSTLVIFDDLGHMPQEEDPIRTVAAVKKFLACGLLASTPDRICGLDTASCRHSHTQSQENGRPAAELPFAGLQERGRRRSAKEVPTMQHQSLALVPDSNRRNPRLLQLRARLSPARRRNH